MSWNKSVELANGVVLGHWEVSKATFDVHTKEIDVQYGGWISLEAKNMKKQAVITPSLKIPASANLSLNSSDLSNVEDYIQAHVAVFNT